MYDYDDEYFRITELANLYAERWGGSDEILSCVALLGYGLFCVVYFWAVGS